MDKIRHIKHKDIDLKKWDTTVLSSELPLVFAQSFYLNATSPNWDALVIGDYESIFPLTVKTKLGFKYLPQPSFTSQLGAYGKIDKDIEQMFYDYITKHFKLIEIELNAANKLRPKNSSVKRTYIIDYKKKYAYNTNTQRNIKKAQSNGIVSEKVEAKDVLQLSKKMISPFLEKEIGLSKPVIKTFNSLIESCNKNNCLLTLKAIDGNKNIKALAHFVYNTKHALYLKGTNFDKKENSGSMHLLIDAAIRYFEDKADIFDFGGGSNAGLASFYKGLGGEELNYSFLRINQLPKVVNVLKRNKVKDL